MLREQSENLCQRWVLDWYTDGKKRLGNCLEKGMKRCDLCEGDGLVKGPVNTPLSMIRAVVTPVTTPRNRVTDV